MSDVSLPDYADIEAAAGRIGPFAVETPLIENPALNERAGRRVLLKLESLQRTGSFKFRGACNRLMLIPEDERGNGVVAFSSGNHAQGVAAAAKLLRMSALIVMPADAPKSKIEGTRGLGAEIVFYDRARDDRETIAAEICARRGATLVRPFDDAGIVAGQGTAGREMALAALARGIDIAELFVPCSGGGLTAGTAIAFQALSPAAEIIAVEPEGYDGMGRSLEAGGRVSAPAGMGSLADALMAPAPGAIPFAVARTKSCRGATVRDDHLRRAVSYCVKVLKIVAEPSGAAGLAAVLCGAMRKKAAAAIIISGANCDIETLSDCCARFPNP